jgi:hypothetical protein
MKSLMMMTAGQELALCVLRGNIQCLVLRLALHALMEKLCVLEVARQKNHASSSARMDSFTIVVQLSAENVRLVPSQIELMLCFVFSVPLVRFQTH